MTPLVDSDERGYTDVTSQYLKPSWLETELKNPNSPYKQKTRKGYQYFHTIKIRLAFKNIMKPIGYPIRYGFDVDYFSGVAIWVPDGWRIAKALTYRNHRDN